jgi:hypothetical protein
MVALFREKIMMLSSASSKGTKSREASEKRSDG